MMSQLSYRDRSNVLPEKHLSHWCDLTWLENSNFCHKVFEKLALRASDTQTPILFGHLELDLFLIGNVIVPSISRLLRANGSQSIALSDKDMPHHINEVVIISWWDLCFSVTHLNIALYKLFPYSYSWSIRCSVVTRLPQSLLMISLQLIAGCTRFISHRREKAIRLLIIVSNSLCQCKMSLLPMMDLTLLR